jgi:hypothetical protein
MIAWLILVAWQTCLEAKKLNRELLIQSEKQIFLNPQKNPSAYFEGLVDAQIGSHLHVWADTIKTLGDGHELLAQSNSMSPVVIQDNNILIFADEFQVNIDTKTGFATNIRLHLADGFIRAVRAEKINALDWRLEDIEYTACDRARPDWHINATKAMFRKGAFLRANHVAFCLGSIPVFGLPQLVVPVQFSSSASKGSKSGFLLPRFLIDQVDKDTYGFGFKQDYYNRITDKADSTFSVDWLLKKGIVFSDEFRWYRSADSYTNLYSHYAIVRDRYVRRGAVIRKGTSKGYWVKGKSFHQHTGLAPGLDGSVLIRTDFGADKRMEYHFFNSTDEVDDSFFNTIELRAQSHFNQFRLAGISNKVFRNSFAGLEKHRLESILATMVLQHNQPTPRIRRDTEDRAQVSYLPQASLSSGYVNILPQLRYRHDILCDYVFYRQQEVERIFVDSTFIEQQEPLPYIKADFFRFTYSPFFKNCFQLPFGTLTPFINPRLQVVGKQKQPWQGESNVFTGRAFAGGGYRVHLRGGAEYALPFAYRYLPHSGAFLSAQSMLRWSYVQHSESNKWFHIDYWDRVYPSNNIAGSVNIVMQKDDWSADIALTQGYDFVKSSERFYMDRSLKQEHVMPLRYDATLAHKHLVIGFSQEYDWPDFQLLQSQLTINLLVKKIDFSLSYLFQKPAMLAEMSYLSRLPHLMHLRVGVPLSKYTSLFYEAQYYAPQRTSLFFLDGIKPIIHRLRFEYKGHCWGFFLGWEEKKFKECDVQRNERSIIFSLRLDSLGSFAKKLKRVPAFVRPLEILKND